MTPELDAPNVWQAIMSRVTSLRERMAESIGARTIYAKENDLIGGWCVGLTPIPLSMEEGKLVADFCCKESAEFCAAAFNNLNVFVNEITDLERKVKQLEAQRPEVEIVLIDAGGWHVDFNEIPIHWAADETKARGWATQNGFRVRG